MKKITTFLIIIVLLFVTANKGIGGTVTDIDGNVYNTVVIGNQEWMLENLKVTKYRDGTPIPYVTDNIEWINLSTDAYCTYDNNVSNADTYGYLYNWYAVNDSCGLAPAGWHVPTDDDWKELEMYLGMSQSEADDDDWRGTNEGAKLKESGYSHWTSPNTGATNESGFGALPGGYRTSGTTGGYLDLALHAYFWSSTEYNNYSAWIRLLPYNRTDVRRNYTDKDAGFSIRCVRDVNTAPTASFTVTSSVGTTDTTFSFDASGSTDAEDASSALQVRWDWESDGTWDTSYDTVKTATKQYGSPGEYWIKLEVKDSGGLTDTTSKRIVVAYSVVNDGYGDYVLVPAGSFQMGDNYGEGNSDELPVHTVTLDSFYIGKYEVTNGEYKKFMDDSGYTNSAYWDSGGFGSYGTEPAYWNDATYKGGGIVGNGSFPVVGVNWYEAMAYCSWLSSKTGMKYRLPTEAEWEKAARGTDQRRYPWGGTIDSSYANYQNSGYPSSNIPASVGFYNGTTQDGFSTNNSASPYGAYDMAGNILEWCTDWYDDNYYSSSPANNPTGPSSGTGRVYRGGSFADGPTPGYTFYQRSSARVSNVPTRRYYHIGFRVARETTIPNTAPIASFTVTPSSGTIATTFSFNADSSSDPEGSSLTYSWDFDNDGTFEITDTSASTATYSYSDTGTKTIKLLVKDSGGLTDDTTGTVTVGNTAPTVSLTFTPDS